MVVDGLCFEDYRTFQVFSSMHATYDCYNSMLGGAIHTPLKSVVPAVEYVLC